MPTQQKFNTVAVPVVAENSQVEALVAHQRRQEFIQSLVVALITVGLMCVVLWLIVILPLFKETPVIVTYQEPPPPKEDPHDRPDLARGMRPKPANSSSARARVLAAAATGPIAVPMPELPDPTGPFGIDDDFNAGFGAGDGDGDGGGGSSFFGTARPGKHAVYIVDFSLSMSSDVAKGGTRIEALKKEMVRSIKALSEKMNFTVIFFSHNAWSIDAPGANPADRGWNGLGATPTVAWYPALPKVKDEFLAKLQGMQAQGNTSWYPPLKMAFAMMPPPDTVYLLSDGEPRDYDQVMNEMSEINRHKVPVDTIAFELPGTPARYMKDVAKVTGGNFTMVYKGKLLSGSAADDLTKSSFDGK
ncbi:MAG: VWA domain-containing protein [Verrucomicrobia bacterium]|nr:VWA domain-containing protein [Verrucomicrobiota bacterium]